MSDSKYWMNSLTDSSEPARTKLIPLGLNRIVPLSSKTVHIFMNGSHNSSRSLRSTKRYPAIFNTRPLTIHCEEFQCKKLCIIFGWSKASIATLLRELRRQDFLGAYAFHTHTISHHMASISLSYALSLLGPS